MFLNLQTVLKVEDLIAAVKFSTKREFTEHTENPRQFKIKKLMTRL